jgi:hypothetical protein
MSPVVRMKPVALTKLVKPYLLLPAPGFNLKMFHVMRSIPTFAH